MHASRARLVFLSVPLAIAVALAGCRCMTNYCDWSIEVTGKDLEHEVDVHVIQFDHDQRTPFEKLTAQDWFANRDRVQEKHTRQFIYRVGKGLDGPVTSPFTAQVKENPERELGVVVFALLQPPVECRIKRADFDRVGRVKVEVGKDYVKVVSAR